MANKILEVSGRPMVVDELIAILGAYIYEMECLKQRLRRQGGAERQTRQQERFDLLRFRCASFVFRVIADNTGDVPHDLAARFLVIHR